LAGRVAWIIDVKRTFSSLVTEPGGKNPVEVLRFTRKDGIVIIQNEF
jgi:hypothetical protein